MQRFHRRPLRDSHILRLLLAFLAVFLVSAFPFVAESSGKGSESNLRPGVAPEIWRNFMTQPRQTVIVELRETPLPRSVPLALRQSAWAQIKAGIVQSLPGGARALKHLYPRFPLVALDLDSAGVAALALRPDLRAIYPDRLRHPLVESSTPFIGADHLHAEGYGGAGTAVAVLDSPVRYGNGAFGDCPSPGAPGCKVAVWENFADQDPLEVMEGNAHGTNVAGIVLGMAPETTILSLNVFMWIEVEGGWRAFDTDIIAAMDWVAAHASEYSIVAINMSLGSEREDPAPCNGESFYAAIETLYDDYSIVSAVAAGNEAQYNSLGSPACVSLATSVGAQYDSDLSATFSYSCIDFIPVLGKISCFSNLNGALDLVAPGLAVTAGGIEDYSGTSMAAPHVAGTVALMQSYWAQTEGAFKSAFWADRYLQIYAVPLPHAGVVYNQMNLDFDRAPDVEAGYAFPAFPREDEAAAIPAALDGLEFTLDVPDAGAIGGVYLHLEIVHPEPSAVTLRLARPDGQSADVTLPEGPTNFNTVLGRNYAAGAFAPLAGDERQGTWRLSLSDGDGGRGYFLSAVLWLAPADCAADCEAAECGDDRCGGRCGDCPEGWICTGKHECLAQGEFCKGDTCASAAEIPVPFAGTIVGNSLECADFFKGSCGGIFAPDKTYTFELPQPGRMSAEAADVNAVLYLKAASCEGKELACEKRLGGENAKIGMELEAGRYYLTVENYDAGEFGLAVDLCAPDCEGKACGDDGCGGSCGECPELTTCNDGGECVCSFAICEAACCAEGEICYEDACCAPDCDGKTCGDDGCGGSCGECETDESCIEGTCQSSNDETDGDQPAGDDDSGSGGGCRHAGSHASGLLVVLFLIASGRRFPKRRSNLI
ncbi:MAG: hypothetical protein C4523_12345 [Myxococcales bacterium]|nr:MAG: hypothetical protein C4523_12345 [Myxococcales bacterium]